MGTIEICNLRNKKPKYLYDVIVDRSSPLGNPFVMETEEFRNEVCNKYLDYFIEQNDMLFIIELNYLYDLYIKHKKLRLFCWCAPKRCHAETIRDYIYYKKKIEEGNKGENRVFNFVKTI